MSKLRERLEEATKLRKNARQINSIMDLTNNLANQLKAVSNLTYADDEIFLISAKRLEKVFNSLIKSMKEKGKVIRA